MSDTIKPADDAGKTESSTAPDTGAGDSGTTPTNDGTLATKLKLMERQFAKLTKENSDLKAAEEARRTAKLTEVERLKETNGTLNGQVESLQSKLDNQAKQFAFKIAATRAGCVNPDAACRLADLSQLELSENGEVSGTQTYLELFQAEHNYFFGQEKPTTTAPSGGNPTTGVPKTPGPQALKNMTREQRSEYFKQREGRQYL